MSALYVMSVRERLEFLKATQNPDGGWGYFPGRTSWLEPTAYAMLALHGDPAAAESLNQAWILVRSWQLPDGAWRPATDVWEAHWSGALAVTLHVIRGIHDDAFQRGVAWLVKTAGAEGGVFRRLFKCLRPSLFATDPALLGWPWRPGNSSWIEPTAHSLIALKKAAPYARSPELLRRVKEGEDMILDHRCRDGGWNYGSREVYGVDLPLFEESTAMALLGLQGLPKEKVADALAVAMRLWRQTRSPLARAWLGICLRNHAQTLPELDRPAGAARGDTLLVALEALACAEGNHGLLRPEANA